MVLELLNILKEVQYISYVKFISTYLFATSDEEDKIELQNKIEDRIVNINKDIKIINNLIDVELIEHKISMLNFNLQQFMEYTEYIELEMQLTSLGIVNPKWPKHDTIKHITSEKSLDIETSTWLKIYTNEVLTYSQILKKCKEAHIFK